MQSSNGEFQFYLLVNFDINSLRLQLAEKLVDSLEMKRSQSVNPPLKKTLSIL